MGGCVAVFDVGKTNVKLIVFDRDGRVVAERSQPNAPLPPDAALALPPARHRARVGLPARGAEGRRRSMPIEAVSISAHGAAGRSGDRSGRRAPPVDYEFDGFAADRRRLRRRPAAVRGDLLAALGPRPQSRSADLLSRTDLPPRVRRQPAPFSPIRNIGPGGFRASWRPKPTALGAHSDLWRPREGRLSSLVEKRGWTRLFPPQRRAWETLGHAQARGRRGDRAFPSVRVICGAHDSNASLVPYLASRSDPFTVLSTGTWVIIMAVGGKGTLNPAERHARQCRRPRPARADGAADARTRVRRARGRKARRARRRPTSRRSSPRASWRCPPSPTRAARSPAAKARSRARRPRRPRRARRSRPSIAR